MIGSMIEKSGNREEWRGKVAEREGNHKESKTPVKSPVEALVDMAVGMMRRPELQKSGRVGIKLTRWNVPSEI